MASALGDEAERFWFGPLVLFGHDRLRRPIYLQKLGLGSCRFAEGWAYIIRRDRGRSVSLFARARNRRCSPFAFSGEKKSPF